MGGKKVFCPLSHSHPYHFHQVSHVWWSNPGIFYILMQNKQITKVLPPSRFVEVVNQIKLLFLSFHPTCALGGCVLARPFNWNSLKHRASFVVRHPPPPSRQGVCEKEQDFSPPGLGSLHQTVMLPVWHSLSTSALVNSPILHTLFITFKGETLLILFWTCSHLAWNTSQPFLGSVGRKLLLRFTFMQLHQLAPNIHASCGWQAYDIWCEDMCSNQDQSLAGCFR